MHDRNHAFDSEAFFQALNAHRLSKGLTWKEVASLTGVAASTLTRMGQGKRPDVDGLAALAVWSGIDVKYFYSSALSHGPEPLSQITTILRADRNLEKEGAAAIDALVRAAYAQLRKRDGEDPS